MLSGEPEPDQLAIVAGNKIIAEAKIGGITPAMFSLRGRKLLCAAYIFLLAFSSVVYRIFL